MTPSQEERARPTTKAERIEAVLEQARLVAQWHDAIGSGPIEVLNAELGELGDLLAALLRDRP